LKNDFKVIFWFLKPYKRQVFLIFLFLFIYSLLETASIGAFYPFINSVLSGSTGAINSGGKVLDCINSVVRLLPIEDKIIAAGIFLLILVTGSNLFGFFAESVATWYRYKLFADFLNRVYRKLMNNQHQYFLEKKQGDLLYVGMNASQSVGEMLLYFPKVGIEFFRIMAIAVLLISISLKITFLIFIIVLLFGLLIHYLSAKVIYPIAVGLQKAQSEITSVFSESVAGIRQIKTFDNFKYWYKRFKDQTYKGRMLSTKNMVCSYIPAKLGQIIGVLFIVLSILFIKLYDPMHFKTFLPIIAVYVVALQRLMPSISNIGNHWMGLKGLAPRLRLTYETLIDEKYLIDEGERHFSGLNKEIKLENVSFSFPTKEDVLNKINLNISKGQTVAFVGESGAGKSTLVDLFTRLNKPTEGNIFVDGIDYTELYLSDWLKHIGMVSQDTFIFHASVRENIKMGKLDATEEEMIRAAEIADAHKFIKEMVAGYDTIVGDRGLKLSGGQRQRIAIARAVVREPEILILDEATSALDNISEKIVQEAMIKAGENRTNIIIAHRLSTIEHADNIVVLNNGKIVEEGRHKELLARKGYYYNLYQRQKEEEEETI